jgi:hypothetical protein
MSAEGGHLGWRSGSLDTILKIDHLRIIHAMFLKIIYKLFPNSDLMVMREFYILNEILIFKYQNILIFISKLESK